MKSNLIDYLFIDELQLNKYLEQAPLKVPKERKNSWKFSLSLTGPAIEAGQEISNRQSNNHEKIQNLLEFLRKNDLLSESRPKTYKDFDNSKPFIYETFIAQKIVIPSQNLKSVNGLAGFSIWISDPEIKALKENGKEYRTTFLYLTEAYWDTRDPHTGFSSYTAFQMLVDGMTGGTPVERWYDKPTKFGFRNREHPTLKLEKLGGILTDTRKVTSLYRKRYISDDAHLIIDDDNYRINDLLGYPIFIANAL